MEEPDLEKEVFDAFMKAVKDFVPPRYKPEKEHWWPHVKQLAKHDAFIASLPLEQREMLVGIIENEKRHAVSAVLYILESYDLFTQEGEKVPIVVYDEPWHLHWLVTNPSIEDLADE